jgi:hypothetical protein
MLDAEPHLVNTWNSYIQVTDGRHLLDSGKVAENVYVQSDGGHCYHGLLFYRGAPKRNGRLLYPRHCGG